MTAWQVEAIGGVLGARVRGIDLRGPLGDGERKDLYELLLEHLVLVFPDQSIEDEHQMDLLSSWGAALHPPHRAHRRHRGGQGGAHCRRRGASALPG